MILVHPSKMVFDEHGALIEVIVSAEDFRSYVRSVVADTAWDELPEPWQDALDRLLIDDVASERGDAVDLSDVLADTAT